MLPLVLGCLLLGIGAWALQALTVQGPIWLVCFFLTALLVVGLGWCSVTFLRANSALGRGDLDTVTSDDPPVPEPASASAGGGLHHRQAARWARTTFMTISLFALAVVLLLTLLSYRNRYIPPTSAGAGAGSPATGVPSAPESEGRFVLYTMPLQGTNAPGVLSWKFKCLVPAHHLARVLFIFWTNGVPTVHTAFSAYVKVGNASIDNDFYLSCERIAAAASQTQTNLVLWHVGLRVGGGGLVLPFPGQPAYLLMKTPAHMTVRSGHQGILPLVDYVGQDGKPTYGQSGVELRIFIEPIKYAPVRTDPFETEGTNYVAGHGPGWTTDEALKAINQWPIDQ